MDVGTWLANSSWFVSIIDFASLKKFVEFLQDYYKMSNQLSDFGTLNKVLCCQFLFFSKHRHSCMIHASPWIYVSYWNYFLETTQIFWPCLDSIKLNFSPLESGPLNYFLCMESSRKLYVCKNSALKHGFILVDILIIFWTLIVPLWDNIGLVPKSKQPDDYCLLHSVM
jgi:hypothetical protein